MSIDFKSSWTSMRPTDAINESRSGGDFCMDATMATVVVVFKGPGSTWPEVWGPVGYW